MNRLAVVSADQTDVREQSEFLQQAERCRSMGSPFVASVLEAVDRQLEKAPISAGMILNWPGNLAAAAVALRVNGALHALARRGSPERLAALYRRDHSDFDGAIALALSQEDRFIADWIQHPTQTNEVARAAAIMAALMTVRTRGVMPFELLELGSSCGLNLNLARYAYKLGAVSAGDPLSSVHVAPTWHGPTPPLVPVSIAASRGVDLKPLTASDEGHRERLLSFAWADQPTRSKRLDEALRVAVSHPPRVEKGDAVSWLAQRLAEPQAAGRCRAVFHTMFLQYLNDGDRNAIAGMISAAGAQATTERPLVWISLEWTPDRSEVELHLTCWPYGERVALARCHPYGDWLEWFDFPKLLPNPSGQLG